MADQLAPPAPITSLYSYDPTPASFQSDSRATNRVWTPPPSPTAPNGVIQKLLEYLNIVPKVGEKTGTFWGRAFGEGIPPSLREPLGEDIQLLSDSKPKSQLHDLLLARTRNR